MGLVVQKFGGSSVKDALRIMEAARKAIRAKSDGKGVIVVVSAQGSTTDDLIAKAAEITSTPSAREMDTTWNAKSTPTSTEFTRPTRAWWPMAWAVRSIWLKVRPRVEAIGWRSWRRSVASTSSAMRSSSAEDGFVKGMGNLGKLGRGVPAGFSRQK